MNKQRLASLTDRSIDLDLRDALGRLKRAEEAMRNERPRRVGGEYHKVLIAIQTIEQALSTRATALSYAHAVINERGGIPE